ncbi:hypothetical protein [Streptomyces sp. NPDC091268]|uniref:hypothetical protein n=1 Tax=Streptomyces sp. NPDC091268 TaxID=3365979 RepID=UPI0037FCD526
MDASRVTFEQFFRWLEMADRGADGRVSKEEWLAFARSEGARREGLEGERYQGLSEEEAAQLFDDLDSDKSGLLDPNDVRAVLKRQAEAAEAATLRVYKLKPPYPTGEVRIDTGVGGNLNYNDGIIRNVKRGNQHEDPKQDTYEVTMYRPVYRADTVIYAKGNLVVGEATQYVSQSMGTSDPQRDKERASWTNGQ